MFITTPPRPQFPQPTVEDVKFEAQGAWNCYGASTRHGAYLTPWETSTAADGLPLVSCRVTGPRAERAMCEFANGLEPVTGAAEQRPQVDYSEAGIVSCSWRRGGVWVRLWAVDTAHAAKAPTPLAMPAKTTVAAPSGRLPFRRNASTSKGN